MPSRSKNKERTKSKAAELNCQAHLGTGAQAETGAKDGNGQQQKQNRGGVSETQHLRIDSTEGSSSSVTLNRGQIYEGKIAKTFINNFVVVIDKRFRVVVFAERFERTHDCPNTPVTCFVAEGETVSLTVQRRRNPNTKFDEEWEAIKCWQKSDLALKSLSLEGLEQNEKIQSGCIAHVVASFVRLCTVPDVIVARRDCTYLFGYRLAKVDLTEVFSEGDELSFVVDDPPTIGLDGLTYAKCAWYGSKCSNEEEGATPEQMTHCMEYCFKRNKLTLCRILIGTNEDKIQDLTEDESDLEYIDPNDLQGKKKPQTIRRKSSQKHLTGDGCYRVESSGVSKKNGVLDTSTKQIQTGTCKLKGASVPGKTGVKAGITVNLASGNEITKDGLAVSRLDGIIQSSLSVLNKCDVIVETVDVATQTYATGDVFSFFKVANVE